MSISPEIIGTIAGALTTISFLPQAIKSIMSPDTKSISLLMYILFTVGVSFWFAFGLMINSNAVTISNGITLALSIIILFKKIYNLVKKID